MNELHRRKRKGLDVDQGIKGPKGKGRKDKFNPKKHDELYAFIVNIIFKDNLQSKGSMIQSNKKSQSHESKREGGL